jgi:cell filamentation protein
MVPIDKYEIEDTDFDPEHGVLRNRLGILDPQEIERHERAALISAYHRAALTYRETDRFTPQDLCDLHRLFLVGLYSWAGTYRKVDIISGDIRWCHARHIETEMARYGTELARFTPFSSSMSRSEVLARLAELHGELIVIHPFRDGNGRTARLFGDLLLMQSGRPPIQLGRFDDSEVRRSYHVAIRTV